MGDDSTVTPADLIREAERCVTLSREVLERQHTAHMEAQEMPHAGAGEAFEAGTRKAGEDLRRSLAVLEAMQAMRGACLAVVEDESNEPAPDSDGHGGRRGASPSDYREALVSAILGAG